MIYGAIVRNRDDVISKLQVLQVTPPSIECSETAESNRISGMSLDIFCPVIQRQTMPEMTEGFREMDV